MAEISKFARPYAKAAFEYANQHNQLALWSQMLGVLAAIVSQDIMRKFLQNPAYSTDQHADICITLAGDQLDEQGQNFVKELAENRKLQALPTVLKLYQEFMQTKAQTIEAKVTSVIPLTEAFQQQLCKTLAQKLGRQVSLDCEIDPDLIGGMVVRAGDVVIDNSVARQLSRLQETLMA